MRKLDDIIPPSRRKEVDMPMAESASSPSEPLRLTKKTPRFPYGTAIVAALVIVGAAGAIFYFSSARVEITPSSNAVTVSGSFTASAGQGDLPFEMISVQKVATQSVAGSGTKTVTQTASGSITIYNTQSKPQLLIATTRFATKNGLIFRIHQAVNVPAGGSVVATAYADQPGDMYNVDPTSFTVPGLSGTPQFSQVYAKSTSSMTGGASGNVPVVVAATEAATRAALVNALAPQLLSQLQTTQVPTGYVLLTGAATTSFVALSSTPSATTGMVDVREQGTMTAIVFPQGPLAKAVASQVLGAGYGGEPMHFSGTDKLVLSSQMPLSADVKTYSFTLSGAATLIYSVDASRIAAAVAGKSRNSAEVALTNYPEVKRAVLILRPFWKQTFPDDPASVSVVVGNP